MPPTTPLSPPLRPTRHTPLTLDTILTTPLDSLPLTASSPISFSTAYSTLDASPQFRYYLPHISTPTSPVYTRSEEYACNLALCSQAVRSPQVGGFWKYVPGRNSGRWGCYVDEEGLGVAVPCVPTKPEVPMKPEVPAEQKVLGKLEQVVLSEPLAPTQGEIKTPLKNIADTHPAHRRNENKEIEIIDNGSYTAGEQLNTCASTPGIVVEKAKKQRAKLTKAWDRKPETIGDISNKVKKMLKKLCLGRRGA